MMADFDPTYVEEVPPLVPTEEELEEIRAVFEESQANQIDGP